MSSTRYENGGNTIQELHNRSQFLMDMSVQFLQYNSPFFCLTFINQAIETMLKALLMKRGAVIITSYTRTLEETYDLFKESDAALEDICFLESIHFLSIEPANSQLIQNITSFQLQRLIHRADNLLFQSSPKVIADSGTVYKSIFKNT
ncbi:hypothetical protein H1230_28375 [Paenibacillus sp. 19GGS1-52]|uniref:hypothetical protein n=1 Tax=Paenibacillus sp. 19GGS1-52 TaxID=2758563 RepID=UPI001EFB5ABA|nr:hypothetical protein [Paenibacillus sp. 19GGS1-52]ULO06832.1 hypothetical protein H1230_28375 [Paenibacillus sp. 19GGS1-52]